MLAYALVGTNDLKKSGAFYDALLAECGAQRAAEPPGVILYAGPSGGPFFGIAEPYDGGRASCGNGSTVGLAAKDPAEVDRMHRKALELGATDEGAPGPRERGPLKFYAGYFRDLDGNKLNLFCM